MRNFRLIWTGAFLSSIGTWIQDVALSWVIHTEFKNPAYLGWRQFASELPLVAFMLLGGVLADRINKKTILMTSQIIQLSLALVLAGLYFTHHLSIWSVVIVGFIWQLILSPLWRVGPRLLGAVGLAEWFAPWLGQEETALLTLSLLVAILASLVVGRGRPCSSSGLAFW